MLTPTTTLRLANQGRELLLADDTTSPVVAVVAGAGLALAVAVIHLQDQGGLLGHQSPTWLRYGYYLIEIASTVAAGLILRSKVAGWMLGLATALSAFTGYLLSRSVGMPGDPGDVGNWGYTLGTISLVVEATFIVLAVLMLRRVMRARRRRPLDADNRTGEQSTVAPPPPWLVVEQPSLP
jgi:hypothetical protein